MKTPGELSITGVSQDLNRRDTGHGHGLAWHQTHAFPAVGQGTGLITSLSLSFLITKRKVIIWASLVVVKTKTRDAVCSGPLPRASRSQVLSNSSSPLSAEVKSELQTLPQAGEEGCSRSSPPPGPLHLSRHAPVLTLFLPLRACSPSSAGSGWGPSSCKRCNEALMTPRAPWRGNIHQIRTCIKAGLQLSSLTGTVCI